MPLMATGGSMGDGEQMADVDAHPDAHRATESDEEKVLRELYGEPDGDGIFRGEAG